MNEPTITLTLPLSAAQLIRLALAHQALGVRPWAAMPDEPDARASLARLEAAQRDVETAIRQQGHPVHPSHEGR
jgi:hypothetical protein